MKSSNNYENNQMKNIILIIGICLIATNLRAPLTSVGSLVTLIKDDLSLSNTLVGMLTTLPLFAFAIFSPIVPKLAHKFGFKVILFWSLICLTLGIILRSWGNSLTLFIGTAIIGLSISAGNVLIPSLIKEEFPRRIGIMTGMYSVSMNVFAALASGISIPLAVNLNLKWSGALKIWIILSIIALIFWCPQMKNEAKKISTFNTIKMNGEYKISLWKSSLAWQVTLYMGLQSMIFYCMVAWLPNILVFQGLSNEKAGWLLSLMQLALIPTTFIVSIIAAKKKNQYLLVVVGSVCTIAGIGGLLFSKINFIAFWIIILGIGGGFTFSLSMMFFNLRTKNSEAAAKLSGMAQSIGYLLAATGPIFLGYLHDINGNWKIPLVFLLTFAIICLLSGLGAARNIHVD